MTTTATNIEQQELPAGWRISKLDDYVDLSGGFAFKSSTYSEIGTNILRVTNIASDGHIDLTRNSVRIKEDLTSKYNEYNLREDDVLVVMVGATVGKLGVVEKENLPCLLNQNMWVMRVKDTSLDSQIYLKYAMVPLVRDHLHKQQGSARTFLSRTEFKNETLFLPPLEEQKRIAAILNEQMAAVEEAKKAAQERLEAAQALPSAYLREVFPSSEDELPAGWKWVKLGDAVNFIGGSQPPKDVFSTEPKPDYVRLVQIRDFKTDDYAVYIPAGQVRRTFSSDDVMIGRYGPPLFQILRGLEGAYNVALIKAVPKNNQMSKDFLFKLLQIPLIQNPVIAQSERSAGQTGVNKTFLEALLAPLPPVLEQSRIASELDDKLAEVKLAEASIQQELATIEAIPAALLRTAFSGGL